QKHLHQMQEIGIHIPFMRIGYFRRLFVGALAEADAAAVRKQILDVALAAVKIRLNHGANSGVPSAGALDEIDGALSVKRTFHINAQEIVKAHGTLGQGDNEALTEIRIDLEAELG